VALSARMWSGGVPVGDPNVPLDNTDSCRDVHRARDQRLSAGRVLIGCRRIGLSAEISGPSISALGHPRPRRSRPHNGACPLRPESGQLADHLGRSALCQKRTHAVQHVLADPSSRSQGGATYFCPAASRISAVIVSGCDMRERWLAFTSIVFASMRFAMKRWRSGLIVRSSVETA
jgi:hypothetical protein